MGRQPCCDKVGLKRGPWTIDEDHKLMNFILNNGIHCWRTVPKLAGLLRCGKSCRLRWINYLRPDLKRGDFTEAEEDQIIQLHSRLGNRWSKIASHFPGRTDNEIKNHWNTRIKKKLKMLGIDPLTHKPAVVDETEPNKLNKGRENETNPRLTESASIPLEDRILDDKIPTTIHDEVGLSLDEITTDLINNYKTLCGDGSLLPEDELLVRDNNYSNSASVGDSNYSNSFTGSVSDSVQSIHSIGNYNSLQPWPFESCVDLILNWDDFDYLGHMDFSLF